MKLNAEQLRKLEEERAKGTVRNIKRHPIYFILENIYDTYNIGGLFRLADAIAAEKIYLCGDSEIPPNSRIKKASIGTYKIVPWEYRKSAKEAIDSLKLEVRGEKLENEVRSEKKNIKLPTSKIQLPNSHFPLQVVAVEQHPDSTDYRKTDYRLPLALIFGNESYGVTPETLKLVDKIVEIPMFGINKSLNVIVSAAIVSYWIINQVGLSS